MTLLVFYVLFQRDYASWEEIRKPFIDRQKNDARNWIKHCQLYLQILAWYLQSRTLARRTCGTPSKLLLRLRTDFFMLLEMNFWQPFFVFSLCLLHSQNLHSVSELAQCVSEVVTFAYRSCDHLWIWTLGEQVWFKMWRAYTYCLVWSQSSTSNAQATLSLITCVYSMHI